MSKTSKSPPEPLDIDNCVYGSHRWERALIDRFLQDALSKIERALNDHRAVAMENRDARLSGVIEYFRHQKSTVEDLIAQNLAKVKRESPTGPRARRNAK